MNPSKIVTIGEHELTRLQDVERAWRAVWQALIDHNPEAFSVRGTGTENAVREIRRLQALEGKKS